MTRKSSVLLLAVSILGASCKQDPQQALRKLLASGDAYMAQRRYADAIVQYRNAVARDGSSGEARSKLGNAYLLTQDPRNALRELVRAADLLPKDVGAQVQAGKVLLLIGQYPEAKARAVAALDNDPKNVEGLLLLGNSLAGMKDIDGAIEHIEEAIDADPKRMLTYANLGALEQARGNADGAESAFKRAVDVAPKSATTHMSLANFYWASNQKVLAEEELKTALSLEPKSPNVNRALAVFYLMSKRNAEALKYLKAFADLSDASAKVTLADYYFASGRPKDARSVLEPLLSTKDGFIPAKLRLAADDFVNNLKPQAYQALDEIFKREKANEPALLEKTRFLIADQRPVEALEAAKVVVTANPGSGAGHFVRGVALEATGSRDEAIKAFQRVLELRPAAVPAQLKLANLLLDKGDTASAVEYLGQALKNQPQSFPGHFILAKALVRRGDVRQAERELKALAAIDGSAPEVQTLFGDFYLAKRELTHARDAYSRALAARPASPEAMTGLVKTDLLDNKKDAARSRIEAQLAKSPNDSTLLMVAGGTFYALGDLARAESSWQRAMQTDPSNMEAYNKLARLYLVQNRLDEARAQYEAAAKEDPKLAVPATTMVGIILTIQNNHQEARKQYERALSIDPQAAVAANNLAWHYADRGGANLDVALSLAQTAKARLPNSWEASDTLGWVYYKKGLATLAVTALRQSVEQNPSNPMTQYHLGLAYLKDNNPSAAQRALQQALKLDPQFDGAQDAKRVLAGIKG